LRGAAAGCRDTSAVAVAVAAAASRGASGAIDGARGSGRGGSCQSLLQLLHACRQLAQGIGQQLCGGEAQAVLPLQPAHLHAGRRATKSTVGFVGDTGGAASVWGKGAGRSATPAGAPARHMHEECEGAHAGVRQVGGSCKCRSRAATAAIETAGRTCASTTSCCTSWVRVVSTCEEASMGPAWGGMQSVQRVKRTGAGQCNWATSG